MSLLIHLPRHQHNLSGDAAQTRVITEELSADSPCASSNLTSSIVYVLEPDDQHLSRTVWEETT